MDPTAADASMEELFGPVLGKRPTPSTLPPKEEATERPAKAGKPNAGGKGRGAGSQGQGSRGRNQRSKGSGGASGQQQQGSQKNLEGLMHQQESISTLRLSTGWVWWLRIPEPSPIAMMIQAAQVWREEVVKPDSPHRETPIRQAIFWSLIQYLKLAIQNLGEEGLKEAKASGWALEDGLPSQSAAAEGAVVAADPRHPGPHPSRDTLPLPRHEKARGGDGRRDGSPLHGCGIQAPGGQCSLREAVPAPGKRGSPGRGHPVSAGVAATPSCSAAAHGSFLGP